MAAARERAGQRRVPRCVVTTGSRMTATYGPAAGTVRFASICAPIAWREAAHAAPASRRSRRRRTAREPQPRVDVHEAPTPERRFRRPETVRRAPIPWPAASASSGAGAGRRLARLLPRWARRARPRRTRVPVELEFERLRRSRWRSRRRRSPLVQPLNVPTARPARKVRSRPHVEHAGPLGLFDARRGDGRVRDHEGAASSQPRS